MNEPVENGCASGSPEAHPIASRLQRGRPAPLAASGGDEHVDVASPPVCAPSAAPSRWLSC